MGFTTSSSVQTSPPCRFPASSGGMCSGGCGSACCNTKWCTQDAQAQSNQHARKSTEHRESRKTQLAKKLLWSDFLSEAHRTAVEVEGVSINGSEVADDVVAGQCHKLHHFGRGRHPQEGPLMLAHVGAFDERGGVGTSGLCNVLARRQDTSGGNMPLICRCVGRRRRRGKWRGCTGRSGL